MNNYKICCLYSGSKGNSTFISAAGTNILIDAGKSARALCTALSQINVDIDSIDAIFVTHEHKDHISALQTLSHKHSIPVHMLLSSAQIFNGLRDEKLCNSLVLYRGKEFEAKIKGLNIKAFPTSHDSLSSVGYRISFDADNGEQISIGYLTDTGCVTDNIKNSLLGCETVILEANHDKEMLENGPYPYDLQQRIRGKLGHLSNCECAALAASLFENGTKNIMLAHLSEENNRPEIAYNEVLSAIASEELNLCVASQYLPVWLEKCQSEGEKTAWQQ